MIFSVEKKFYRVSGRMFNVVLQNENVQIDACLTLALVLFQRGFKIEVWHDFDLPQFDWRIFKLKSVR